jgi:hypothetical protein
VRQRQFKTPAKAAPKTKDAEDERPKQGQSSLREHVFGPVRVGRSSEAFMARCSGYAPVSPPIQAYAQPQADVGHQRENSRWVTAEA